MSSMDNKIATFIRITNSTAVYAERYLRMADGDLEEAVLAFFDFAAILQDSEPAALTTRVSHSRQTLAGEPNGVRAPIARTTETLVGPEDDYIGTMSAQMRRGINGMFTHCQCLRFL